MKTARAQRGYRQAGVGSAATGATGERRPPAAPSAGHGVTDRQWLDMARPSRAVRVKIRIQVLLVG